VYICKKNDRSHQEESYPDQMLANCHGNGQTHAPMIPQNTTGFYESKRLPWDYFGEYEIIRMFFLNRDI
jgi:hypothetical protein